MTQAFAKWERDAEIIAFPVARHSTGETSSSADVTPEPDTHAVVTALRAATEEVVNAPVVPPARESSDAPAEAPVAPKALRKAHNVSLHALATRGQSRAEIEKRLAGKELSQDVIEEEMDRLMRAGLIDDDALAADLVEKWAVREGMGRHAVASKLRQRLFSGEVIEIALAALGEEEESERLEEVAADRARKLQGLTHAVAKRRLEAFLARKGYRGSEVREVIARVLG